MRNFAYRMGKQAADPSAITQAIPAMSRIKAIAPSTTQKVDFVVQILKDYMADIAKQKALRKKLMVFGIPGALGAAGLAGGLGYMAGRRGKGQ